MKKDKITTLWEKDGDLMRIQNFFKCISPSDNLKDRIKEKTLNKISAPDDSRVALIPETIQQNEEKTRLKKVISIFKNKNRIIKITSAAAVLVLAVYLGTSGLLMLGNSTKEDSVALNGLFTGEMGQNQAADTAAGAEPSSMESSYTMDGSLAGGSEKQFARETPLSGAVVGEENVIGQKLIYTMDVTIKTSDVAATMENVQEKVKSVGGYIVDSNINNDSYQVTAHITMKVPAKEFDSFKGNLSQFGHIEHQHLSTNDVSKEYFDTETRLKSWEAQEQRYLEILQQAKTVEDILRIEEYLHNVRIQIESLKGQLKYWDNQVDYSTIHMSIYPLQSDIAVKDPWQPVSMKNTLIAAKNALIKSISFIWNAINYVIVFIGYALPVIIILALIWTGWIVVRKYRKNKQ